MRLFLISRKRAKNARFLITVLIICAVKMRGNMTARLFRLEWYKDDRSAYERGYNACLDDIARKSLDLIEEVQYD